MITHIKGRLSEKSPTNVVIETNGIGYWVNISLTTFSQIPDQESIKLYTHLQIKEDSHSLYGFYTIKEREIFRLLISRFSNIMILRLKEILLKIKFM